MAVRRPSGHPQLQVCVPVPIPDPALLRKTRGRKVFAHSLHWYVFMSPYPSFPHPVFLGFFIFLPYFFYLVSHLLPNRPLSNNKRKQKNPLAVPFKCLPCICCLFIADSFKPQWQSIRNVVNPSFKSMPRKDLFSLLAFFYDFCWSLYSVPKFHWDLFILNKFSNKSRRVLFLL